MSFTVRILGSGSALPTSRRLPSAQFIECENRYLLIDCGEGTQMQLRKYGLKFQAIDYIFISHLHGDHYFGLFGLLSSFHLLGRTKKLKLFGPAELNSIIEQIQQAGKGHFSYRIEFVALDDKIGEVIVEDRKFRVRCIPLKHKIKCFGFVVESLPKERKLLAAKAKEAGIPKVYFTALKKSQDVLTDNGQEFKYLDYTSEGEPMRSYAYCSDTAYFPKLIKYIKGVDVLYHEATFLKGLKDRAIQTQHSTAEEAAEIAKEAQVGYLLMGHLSARYDSGEEHIAEASSVFPHCDVVEDGMTFSIPYSEK